MENALTVLNWISDNLVVLCIFIIFIEIPILSVTVLSMSIIAITYLIFGDLIFSIEWMIISTFLPDRMESIFAFWTPYVLAGLGGYGTAMSECRDIFPDQFNSIKKSKLEKLAESVKVEYE